MSVEIDNAGRLKNLQERVEKIKETKTGAEAEYRVLKKQYEEELEKLKDLGITNLKDLNKTINEKKAELEELYGEIETTLESLESKIEDLQGGESEEED